MKTKILTLGLICFFIFAYCKSPADPEIKKTLNPKIEEGTKIQIRFSLQVTSCGKWPAELGGIAWYEIFEIYINDGIGTYGGGLLIHTHEFGSDGTRYYEKPERYHSFVPALDFPGTRTRCPGAFKRNTESDFEVWFYLKESNIPSDLIRKVNPKILIKLAPMDKNLQYTDTRFECWPYNLSSNCLSWAVGERTVSSPNAYYNRLHFRVMIIEDK